MWAMLLFIVGCAEPAEVRYELQLASTSVRYGADDRIAARVLPGRADDADEAGASPLVLLHASAPWPVVLIDNGTTDAAMSVVTLENVDVNALLSARFEPLPGDGRSDARCGRSPYADLEVVEAAAPSASADGTTLTFVLEAPPCTRVRVSLAPAAEMVRFAVIGASDGDESWMASTLAAAEVEADVIVVVGEMTDRRFGFVKLGEALDAAALPYIVAMTPQARKDDASSFRSQFGQTDFRFDIGAQQMVVLDTSSAQFSESQVDFLDNIEARDGGVAIMHTLPVSRSTVEGFRTAYQGVAVSEALLDRGFELWVGASTGAPLREEFGDATLWRVGAAPDRELVVVEVSTAACDNDSCEEVVEARPVSY
jgi:hypothetical protein